MKWFDASQEELAHYQELRTDQEAMMAAQMPARGPRAPRKESKAQQPPQEQQEQLPSRPGERVASMI
jgi:hypothetical protein